MDIIIIEDNADLAENLRTFLTLLGFKTKIGLTAEAGLRKVIQHAPRIVLLDHHLPDATGLDLLPKLREVSPETDVVMITAAGSEQVAVDAIKGGAVDYIPKPVALDELRQLIGRLTLEPRSRESRHRLHLVQSARPAGGVDAMSEARNAHALAPVPVSGTGVPSPLDRIKGNSIAVKQLRRKLRMLAKSDPAPVMISGEHGTGKELAARVLHDCLGGAPSAFVVINCAGIPDSEFEVDLSRHVEIGMAVEGGAPATLFLDELGFLGPAAQSALFRLMASRQATSGGLRIIAAASIPLEPALRSGRFRDDLYYRLRTRRIHMPALRERENDTRVLAEHFLRHGDDKRRRMISLSPQALSAIRTYGWPGNVRELEMRIARAIALGGARIVAEDLGLSAKPDGTTGTDDDLQAC